MIWSDQDIIGGLTRGQIKIEGMEHGAIQPASVDVRLGAVFFKFKFTDDDYLDHVIDVRQPVANMMERVVHEEYIDLPPHGFMIGMTMERVSLSDRVVARVEGKSSLGRIGLTVHSTAGFIDPGNQDLNITLELFNQTHLPIRLYPGMWIAQLAFQDTKSPCAIPYGPKRGSRYYGDHEPVPSKVAEKL
jgi:dCTP deaminase